MWDATYVGPDAPQPVHDPLEPFATVARRAAAARGAVTAVGLAALVAGGVQVLLYATDSDVPPMSTLGSLSMPVALAASAGILFTIAYLVGIITWLRWQAAASRAVPTFERGSSVALNWFIPVANLWLPARDVGELYLDATGRPARGLIRAWWLTLLIGAASLVYVTNGIGLHLGTPPGVIGRTEGLVRSVMLMSFAVSAVFARRIVRDVTAAVVGDRRVPAEAGGALWAPVAIVGGITAVFVALAVGLGLFLSDATAEERALVHRYLEAAAGNEADAMYELVGPSITEAVSDDEFAATVRSDDAEYDWTEIGVRSQQMNGQDTTAIVIEFEHEQAPARAEFLLMSDDDGWRIEGLHVRVQSEDDVEALKDVAAFVGLPERILNI